MKRKTLNIDPDFVQARQEGQGFLVEIQDSRNRVVIHFSDRFFLRLLIRRLWDIAIAWRQDQKATEDEIRATVAR